MLRRRLVTRIGHSSPRHAHADNRCVSARATCLRERFAAALPGWLYLLAGLALAALAMIVPASMAGGELAWQRDVMQTQLEHLQNQFDRYHAFDQALAEDDPVLLERLAYLQLRQKPVDKRYLPTHAAHLATRTSRHATRDVSHAAWPLEESAPSVDALLQEPLPRVGVELPDYQPINSRLTRLTAGHSRLVLFAAALALSLAGLFSSLNHTPDPPDPPRL